MNRQNNVITMNKPTESLGEMSKMYTVFGYNSTPTSPELKSRNEGFLAFFEPTTTNPREAAERAISIHCGNISIYFTGGENHFEKVVKLVENEDHIAVLRAARQKAVDALLRTGKVEVAPPIKQSEASTLCAT